MSIERGEEAHPKFQHMKQRKRQIRCCLNLVKKLDRFHTDCGQNEVEYKRLMLEEAQELAGSPFDGALVGVIGSEYLTQVCS